METDALNRRLPYSRPAPAGEKTRLEPADIAVFSALHRHGPLHPPFLFPFSGRKNYKTFQERLRTLYHGTTTNGPFLVRPTDYRFYRNRSDFVIHDLHEKGRRVLDAEGMLSPYIDRHDHAFHRFMGACIGASIELACREKGLGYVSRHEILDRKKTPLALPHKDKELEPDELFGIEYGAAYRFFALEYDRGTEQQSERSTGKKSMESMFNAYLDIFDARTYKDVWGIPGLMVLTVTVGIGRITTMKKTLLDCIEKRGYDPKLADRFLFKAYKTFSMEDWTVPKAPLMDILDPWDSIKGKFDITKA